ncbi:TonB-dependent receptor [Hirschia maritima]|uniref:TonB-dependent receptor n=1 Tax=Hirschia maritima TaxID=1121961 RepID=UPI00037EFCDC|nr:TonB-dependent receptor [Hirschia maritima]
MKLRNLKLMSSALVLGGLLTPQASAQEEGESPKVEDTIIVTATKRASTIQEVPFSINAQTADDIEKSGANNLEDVARSVAGLSIQNLGPGQSQVAIRGVSAGQIVRDQPGVKEQVGVYLDESVISLSLFTPDLDLFDLNRVETLRGPQGTLFGSGSMGGTIRYITEQPSLDGFEGKVEANAHTVKDGNQGGHLKGAVNIPMGDTAALRAVAYTTQYAGYIDALGPNGSRDEDVNTGTRTGGRLAMLFEPTENISITPRVIYQEIQADGFNREEAFNWLTAGAQLGPREQFLLGDEEFKDETLLADLTATIDFGPVELTSVTSFADRSILVSRDASALTHSVSADLGYDAGIYSTPSNLRDSTAYESWTQELRLSSNSEGPFHWLGGLFYSTNDRSYKQRLPTPGYDVATDAALGAGTSAAVANGFGVDSPFNSDLDYTLDQWAVFGEVNWDITDRLTATVGGRYYDFEEDRTISSGGLFANGDSGVVDTTSSSGFTPRFLVSYELNDVVTLNAQAAQGFRLGGVNDPLNATLCNAADEAIFGGFQAYDDETMWNYEAGLKAKQGSFTFSGAVFRSEIKDLQVTLDAGSCSSRVVFNVPEAHTQGIEAEMGYSPFDGFDMNIALSLLESEFDSTVVDGTGSILAGIEEGNRLPSVPEYQLSVSGSYYWDAGIAGASAFVAGSLQLIGDRFTQPSDQIAGQGLPTATGLVNGTFDGTENPSTLVDLDLDSYQTLNLSTGLEFETWDLILYVNNATDEDADLSFDRERGGRARLGFRTNNPRTVGVTVRKSF